MKKKDKQPSKNESFLDNKYQMLCISIGCSLGMCIGVCLGKPVFDSLPIGLCLGMSVGMGLGVGIGACIDRRIAEQALYITDILEDDFGCEGVPDDAEVCVTLILADAAGSETRRRIPDRLAAERNLQVGDRIYFAKNGNIEKFRRSEKR